MKMNMKTGIFINRIIVISVCFMLLCPYTVPAGAVELPAVPGDEEIPEISLEIDDTDSADGTDGTDDTEVFTGAGQDLKSSIKLNRTTLRLKKGEKATLKLKGVGSDEKVIWSAGKGGIVKLGNSRRRKCTVTAKKTGTVTVKAKYRGKVYKCRVTVTASCAKTIKFGKKKYKLSYADEFNTFDTDRWAYCPEQERQDAGGFWRNSCTKVKNGKLVITCKTDKKGTPVSGAIRSTKDYEQKYGLYHIRFKAEKADGLWYALWLLSDGMDDSTVGRGATDGAELDMIELVPHTGELCMSVHWDGYGKHLKSYCETDLKMTPKKDFYDRYHDLWYQWDKHGYRLYMDGTDKDDLIFDFDGKEHGDGTCAVPCDLIISAEFGKWGGKIRRSKLPAHFYVDYVRVYKEM